MLGLLPTPVQNLPAHERHALTKPHRSRKLLASDQLADVLWMKRDVGSEVLQQDKTIIVRFGNNACGHFHIGLLIHSGALWRVNGQDLPAALSKVCGGFCIRAQAASGKIEKVFHGPRSYDVVRLEADHPQQSAFGHWTATLGSRTLV